MPDDHVLGIRPRQAAAIITAMENSCELCHDAFPPHLLEIHRISHRIFPEMARDPTTRFLVLCQPCHSHVHTLPVSISRQRAIVRRRSFYRRRDLRTILGYRPCPYVAPETVDPSLIYEEYLGRCPPGSYRLGG